jgi:predicted TIM-barrel fold metal-dependent hydrolase
MGSVIGENLIEAIAVARADNRVFIATDGLRGIGEIAAAVGAIGASRVVFASGAPVQALGAALAMVAAAEISDSDREAILNGNARRLLSGRNATA